MHLRQLRYLQLIVMHGSFASAARAAGVSQSAISQAMQALEREWGFAVFERAGRRKIATPAAQLAAARAAELESSVARLAHAGSAAGTVANAMRPVLRVGISAAAAILYGVAIARVWRQSQPHGLLRLVGGGSPQLLAGLQRGELDLVIAPQPRRFEAGEIERRVLFSSAPSIYARADHPLASAQSLEALVGAGWVVAGPQGTPGNVIDEAHRVRKLPPPRIEVECADYATLLHLVAGTDLLGIIPHPASVPEAVRPSVVALRVQEGLPQYEVCLFRRSARHAEPPGVVDRIVQELAGG